MKLIYTGANGQRVRFSKGVDIPSGRDYVETGDEVVAHSEAIAADLIKQGVCVAADKPQPKRSAKKDEPVTE